MDYSTAKEKIAEHGLDKFSPPLLLAKVANYVANNYNLGERITELQDNQYEFGKLGLELQSMISTIGGANDEVIENLKEFDSSQGSIVADLLIFFANHLDSSLLFALEAYENPQLPLNEVVAFEDMENVADDQVFPLFMEKIKAASPSGTSSWLFTHNLNEKEWKLVERHLKEINVDHCHRLLMLLLRLDVTVMSFFGSTRLEPLESQIEELHKEGKSNLIVPKAAGICDLLVAGPSLLNIEKVKQNARTRVTQYTLEEAPPTRAGTQRLQISSGAADPSSASKGRNYQRGGGRHRGRGNFRHHYNKRDKDTLHNQIYDEIDRQLAETKGPYFKDKKRGRS